MALVGVAWAAVARMVVAGMAATGPVVTLVGDLAVLLVVAVKVSSAAPKVANADTREAERYALKN